MRVVQGVVSGVLLGLGAALLLFSYAKVAIGTTAFPIVIAIGLVAGVVLGVLASRKGKGSSEASASAG